MKAFQHLAKFSPTYFYVGLPIERPLLYLAELRAVQIAKILIPFFIRGLLRRLLAATDCAAEALLRGRPVVHSETVLVTGFLVVSSSAVTHTWNLNAWLEAGRLSREGRIGDRARRGVVATALDKSGAEVLLRLYYWCLIGHLSITQRV